MIDLLLNRFHNGKETRLHGFRIKPEKVEALTTRPVRKKRQDIITSFNTLPDAEVGGNTLEVID